MSSEIRGFSPNRGESLRQAETVYQLRCGIVITGLAGTGKGSTLKLLEQQYGVSPTNIGDLVRKQEIETVGSFGGARPRSADYDHRMDDIQRKLIAKASEPFLLDSWLGAAFTTRMQQEGLITYPIVRVLLYGDPTVISERAAKRDAKRNGISQQEALDASTARFHADWAQWQRLYNLPDGLYQQKAQDHDGTPFYDIEIDVTELPKEGAAEKLHELFLERGFIEAVQTIREPIQVFPAV